MLFKSKDNEFFVFIPLFYVILQPILKTIKSTLN